MRAKLFLILMSVIISGELYSQKSGAPCCSIIDMSKDEGTFTIRDRNSGRIQLFKPDALEGAELKIGDSVDVIYDSRKITSIRGVEKLYDLLDAPFMDSCCVVMQIDSVATDSLFTVVAKNNTTGEKIHFKVPPLLATTIKDGEVIFTRPSHGYAMIAAPDKDSATRKVLYGFPLLQN